MWQRSALLLSLLSVFLINHPAQAQSGRTDYDLDNNGLIEINDLADLNEIRNDMTGTSLYGQSTGCPADGCKGFELMADLDFDTNGDGVIDANDTYWNDGAGWVPLGNGNKGFRAIFDGNGHEIRNLFINNPAQHISYYPTGLFGTVGRATIKNVGLTGGLTSISGYRSVGAIAGSAVGSTFSGVYSIGHVISRTASSGGLVGSLQGSSLNTCFFTGIVSAEDSYVGGVAGFVDKSSISNCFASAQVEADSIAGGLVGRLVSENVVTNSYAAGYIRENPLSVLLGGLVGDIAYSTNSIQNSYWVTDTTGQDVSDGSSGQEGYFGATLLVLQCPASENNIRCLSGKTLYADWGDATYVAADGSNVPVWDFGSSFQLPALNINGKLYRDSDGDSVPDDDDAFPYNPAAAIDSDGDDYPDAWISACEEDCQAGSGLILDEYPGSAAAWKDSDGDGYPDDWADNCDRECQLSSGLSVDEYPDDYDNDGLTTASDDDDNGDGIVDADADSDGLIDISTLQQLNAIRFDLTGQGRILSEGGASDSSGCPLRLVDGVRKNLCFGYELTADLDFDTNHDGVIDSNDDYWNNGEGWAPLGYDLPFESVEEIFTAVFDGNGHTIKNLYMNRNGYDQGLFGNIGGATITNIGLTGKLTNISGGWDVGGLIGVASASKISNSYIADGVVKSMGSTGGLIGSASDTEIKNVFSVASVYGEGLYSGGLIGEMGGCSLINGFATGLISASTTRENYSSYAAGLIGSIYRSSSVSNVYATGYIDSLKNTAGLLADTNYPTNISFSESYWATDSTGQSISVEGTDTYEYKGLKLAMLQCPTKTDDADCAADTNLFSGWGSETYSDMSGNLITVWDFGTSTQLPALNINGTLYRDSDGDGSLDENDDFPFDRAASVDEDGDGYPDSWNIGCNDDCVSESGLIFDALPGNRAAGADGDQDGYPDSWAIVCNRECQSDSGLTLDEYPDDYDNDGLTTAEDNDDNNDGIEDADADSDGLIDVSTLEELNAIRFSLNGEGQVMTEGGDVDSSGCPAQIVDGTEKAVCYGYELTTDLDFDTNGDGAIDENDEYWNSGAGWEPLSYHASDSEFKNFTATFNGNGHKILNLFIDRINTSYVGLFGRVADSDIKNISLSGGLTSISGRRYVGGLVGYAYGRVVVTNVVINGSVNASGGYAGGMIGRASRTEINNSLSTVKVVGGEDYVGGLVGYLYESCKVDSSFATGSVTATYSNDVGGLVGAIVAESNISHVYATGYVVGADYVGGLIGSVLNPTVSVTDSYWAADSTGQNNSDNSPKDDGYFGVSLAELQCPTSANNTDCIAGNNLFTGWANDIYANSSGDSINVWDFGTSSQLPALNINGTLYRDSDGDGSLDENDDFPFNRASSVDKDGDGYPDSWNVGCNSDCVSESGLIFDAFPGNRAAGADGDQDGYPDSWAIVCNRECQNASGLTLDEYPDDYDNDGLTTAEDNDDNNDGIEDADADSDGLIDVSTLEELNAIRFSLNGEGQVMAESGDLDSSGCPVREVDGTEKAVCYGYELITDLNFDTNGDGAIDENDEYWNSGAGWEPLGNISNSFSATFNGNGHEILNLLIDRSQESYVGLFGTILGATVERVGLTGNQVSITGYGYVGGLIGASALGSEVRNCYTSGEVTGSDDYVGGLIGYSSSTDISNSFSTALIEVNNSARYAGGLIGNMRSGNSLVNSYATGNVSATGGEYIGGLIGYLYQDNAVNNTYASGRVSGSNYVGGLVGFSRENTINNSYWATDTSGLNDAIGDYGTSSTFTEINGAELEQLKCPTAADDISCVYGTVLYKGWGDEKYINTSEEIAQLWNFGSSSDLPTLNLDDYLADAIDSDGDGVLDYFDAFPNDASKTTDGDSDDTSSGGSSGGGGGGSLLWLLALAPLAGVSRRKSAQLNKAA